MTSSATLRRRLYFATAFIALLGLADASYLTYEHMSGATLECLESGGCEEVLASKYAAVGPVPLAAFGIVAYFSVIVAAILAARGSRRASLFLTLLVCGMFAFSLWLFYLQAAVIRAFCVYCLFSAGVTTVMTALTLSTAYRLRER